MSKYSTIKHSKKSEVAALLRKVPSLTQVVDKEEIWHDAIEIAVDL